MKGFLKTKGGIALLVVAAFAVGGSVAWAATSGGEIVHGCVAKNGSLSVSSSGACSKNETAADWYTKDGADATFLGIDAQATDSAALGGQPASSYLTTDKASAAYLGKGDTAANSAELGGLDASHFVHGAQTITSGTVGVDMPGPGGSELIPLVGTADWRVTGECSYGTGCRTYVSSPSGVGGQVWHEDASDGVQFDMLSGSFLGIFESRTNGASHVVWHGLFGGRRFTVDLWRANDASTATFDWTATTG